MRIAIVKPDYKIIGGFEIVLDKIIQGLKNESYQVDYIKVDMTNQEKSIGNIKIPEKVYNENQEFFRYVISIDKFRKLDLKSYDLVIATQPPSFAVNHNNVVCLFYHHHKIYYDLYDVFMEINEKNRLINEKAMTIIRDIDSLYLDEDKIYLAGSKHIANRLEKFNGIKKNKFVFEAGIDDAYYNYTGPINYNSPICVGRHEFPKRPELFIHAMKHLEGIEGYLIGTGGQTNSLIKLDKYLTHLHYMNRDIDDEYLWKKLKIDNIRESYKSEITNVRFMGRLSKESLIEEYANALCVVCPAYEEDYGLTAIEAMAFQKPVIACDDGGGYTEFIKDGYNGFVVHPTGEAIAEKIKYLKANPEILYSMGKNAYEFSRKYSWKNSIKSFNTIITNAI